MHPRGGREGRLPLPRPAGPKQEYQMDPQREKAMRSIFGEAEVPDKDSLFQIFALFFSCVLTYSCFYLYF